MQSDRDLLKQALEWFTDCYRHSGLTAARWGMDAMRERLAQREQPKEQPMKAATTATEAIKLFPEVAYWYREFLEHNTVGGIEALKSSEDQLADPYNTEVRVAIAALREQLTQPEKSPLDRMAENARELGLDYEPVDTKVNSEAIPEQIFEPEQEPVAWLHWVYGPVRLFMNKDEAMLEMERLNREYPSTYRKLLPLYISPQPEQEPVAWMYVNMDGECEQIEYLEGESMPDDPSITPLYTIPPRREWVGLTDSDKAELDEKYGDDTLAHFDAIEAKLKEKNA